MLRPGSSLSRQKQQTPVIAPTHATKKEVKVPTLEDFLSTGDFAGALALIQFEKRAKIPRDHATLWEAYCHFHRGEYAEALKVYETVKTGEGELFACLCLFGLCEYEKAFHRVTRLPPSPLGTRVALHAAQRLGDEAALLRTHAALSSETLEDRLTVAAMQYLRGHYEEAVNTYKTILTPEKFALHYYVAMCYYKLEYYDQALECVEKYLSKYPLSITGVNLKACIQFQLYDGRTAETELNTLKNANAEIFKVHEILLHNVTVFRGGEGGMTVFPPLVDGFHEAKTNLAIFHVKHHNPSTAHGIMNADGDASTRTRIVKAVAAFLQGTMGKQPELVAAARSLWQLVGTSPQECDTIPGRQAMASALFVDHKYEELLVYLRSIKPYMETEDAFHWNFAVALIAAKDDANEALEALQVIASDDIKNSIAYKQLLARALILVNKPALAWEIFMKCETPHECAALLPLIAADCYLRAHWHFALKAYDALEKLDPSEPLYWEGKRGAACAIFQQIVAGKEDAETLQELLEVLRTSANSQAEYIANRVILKWAKERAISVQ